MHFEAKCTSFYVVALDSICETHFLALDGFDINFVHKLSSREKSGRSWDSNPGLLRAK